MVKEKVTLKLLHGRNSPDDQPKDWGFDGPSLGPLVGVQLTYGFVALFAEVDDRVELPRVRGLFAYDGKFYGDVSILPARTHPPTEQVDERKTKVAGLPYWSEKNPVVLPPRLWRQYCTRRAVFVDSLRELAGDRTADSVLRALSDVVPDRLNTNPSYLDWTSARRRTTRERPRFARGTP